MAKQCKKCVKGIRGIEYAKCGYCEQVLHFSCCSLTRPNYELISSNGLYLCEDCRLLVQDSSLKELCPVSGSAISLEFFERQMNDLKQQITALMEIIQTSNADTNASIRKLESQITAQNSHLDAAPNIVLNEPNVNTTSSLPLFSRQKATNQRMDIVERPVHNPGTQGTSENMISVSAPSLVPAARPDLFWLYLSGLHPLISAEDVQNVVTSCLQINDPFSVIKLFPKDKDISTATFISFKIGLPLCYKTAALLPETWPIGVRFREFENKPKNYTAQIASN